MASTGASSFRRAMLTLRLELTTTSNGCSRLIIATRTAKSNGLHCTRSYGTLFTNNFQETWCRRWWNISRKGLSTSTRTFTPSLSPILSKEHQYSKEAKESRESKDTRESKEGKEPKDTKNTKESKKQAKEKTSTIIPPEVTVECHRGLPRITVPLPSLPQKCMFTMKPITQTVGDLLNLIKQEDPAVVEASVTTIDGTKLGSTNKIETLLMDDFNLIINDKIYPVSPPPQFESPKENLMQLRDVQAMVCQVYDTLNARECHATLEKDVLLQLEEVNTELEPLEQKRLEIEEAAARRATIAFYALLVFISMQFGGLARLTWWEYSWDIMEPVTYFLTYATTMGCFIYFLITKQEYGLSMVFQREHLISLHKMARKHGFDLVRYNRLKDEAHELNMMLRIIRGPLYIHQVAIEQKRRERLDLTRSSTSSSTSSSRSPSSSVSPSPSPEKTLDPKKTRQYTDKSSSSAPKTSHASAVIRN